MSRKTKQKKLSDAAEQARGASAPGGSSSRPSSSSLSPNTDWFESLAVHRRAIGLALALVLVIWVVFRVTSTFSFLTLDDREVVTSNRIVTSGLTAENLSFVFWDKSAGNWIPATWISHMLDTQWEGGDPAAHHETNVWLHGISAVLFFALLIGLTGATARSLAAAAFFALHPLRAQSVAWVAERQGLLAACFSFLTLAAWAWARRKDSRIAYGAALAAYALALMASPSAIVLPIILIALEYWPLESAAGGEGKWWRDKMAFGAMSVAALALWMVRFSAAAPPSGGRVWAVEASFWPAVANTFWPVSLTPLAAPASGQDRLFGAGILVLLAVIAVAAGRRHRYITTGVVWFVAGLLGAVTLSEFARHSYADRFTYFAHAGLGIAIAWLGHTFLGERARYAAAAIGVVMAWQCWVQLSYWKDDATLFGRAVELDPKSGSAHAAAGEAYLLAGNSDKAIGAFRKAVAIAPQSAANRLQLAQALFAADKNEEALTEIDRALVDDPKMGSAQHSRGMVLRALDRQEEASAAFQKALDLGISPEQRQNALLNLGLIEVRLKRDSEALRYFHLALERDPKFYLARKNVAFILARQEKWAEAKREFETLYAASRDDEDVQKALRSLQQRLKQ